jgi:type VI secretion system protein ImpK
MNEKGRPPNNPFGRGDRTIIRPNPGGRLPATPNSAPAGGPQLPPSPTPAPAGSSPHPPTPGVTSQPASSPPQAPSPFQPQSQAYAAAPTTHAQEEWISTPARPIPNPPQPPPRVLRVDELVAPNANPILRAAGPLLLLLGRLRVSLSRASFAALMEQVAEAINFFERDIRSAGIPENQANNAKYILCATADDIVQHIPTDDRHVWTQYSMLSRFFGERVGGVRFFEILNQNKFDPLLNYPVLELQHACLALGFQGMYRTGGGVASLQQVQRDLYEILRRVRPKVARDLSVHWRGQALPSNPSRIRVPVWVVASAAGVLLFGLFVTLRYLLGGNSEAAAAMTKTLHSNDQLALVRKVIAPPPPPPPPAPPPPQAARIEKQLPSQIGDCKITVQTTANQHIIRVCGSITFASGSDTVLDQFKSVAAQIARALDAEPGAIKVVGHTDSDPVSYREPWKSNYELSLARATKVADLIKSKLHDPKRVQVEGKGSDVPIVKNDTAAGKATNRRVEVMIARARE